MTEEAESEGTVGARAPNGAGGAEESAAEIRRRLGDFRPSLGLILGSGLGGLGAGFEDRIEISYDELPGWPPVGVEGHSGVLVAGDLSGVPAVALKGRAHLYEGHSANLATLPVRALSRLGIGTLFVSNAAGAIDPGFDPGDLMLIRDHLNLMWRNPLIGAGPGDPARPRMRDCYDDELGDAVRGAARDLGLPLREGVYAALLGPSFETPAEIRMLARLGADAVGMSTVPEVITARALGIRCFGVSCLTNYAAGIGEQPLSHDEVMETTERVAASFQDLVRGAVRRAAPLLMA